MSSLVSGRPVVWVILAVCMHASGCAPPQSGGVTIATTCGMVTDIVRAVVGDKAQVVGIIREGKDPHTYKPTGKDTKKLALADVVFYCGLNLEGRMTDSFAKAGRHGKPVYAVTESLDESYLREPPEFKGHFDPHVWMDVSAWRQCVGFVARAMGEYDPAHRDYYADNARAYQKELAVLDEYVKRVIATIPENQRVLITAHDAFGYFARAYGMQVRSVQGLTTESEAGLEDVNRLVDFIVENKIASIFVESSVPEDSIQAVVEGAADKNWTVRIGGTLFSDAMGSEGTYEGTYIGMIDHNATLIARSLGGQAPARGLHGRLSLDK